MWYWELNLGQLSVRNTPYPLYSLPTWFNGCDFLYKIYHQNVSGYASEKDKKNLIIQLRLTCRFINLRLFIFLTNPKCPYLLMTRHKQKVY